MKMRLNKYQKVWIDRLLSGETRKCTGKLADGEGRNCCLGVAINICKLEKMRPENYRDNEDLNDAPKTLKALKLTDGYGSIDDSLITKEWKAKLNKMGEFVTVRLNCLIALNDHTLMTHKEIGQFINDNREAVFGNK